MKIIIIPCFVVLLLCLGVKGGFGSDVKDEKKVFAVQERLFHRSHELTFSLGYIPDDDFFEVYPVGLSYTFHYDYNFAWEVIRGEYLITQDKEIKGKLKNDFGVAISEFPEPIYMIHTNFIIKPLYGKQALWNKDIVNNESCLFVGCGMIKYKRHYFEEESESEFIFSTCLGLGAKFYLSNNWCLNIEIRDLVIFREEKIENNILIGLGFGFRFNLQPRKTEKDRTMETLKKYLNKSKEK